jgi:hypothetical protein
VHTAHRDGEDDRDTDFVKDAMFEFGPEHDEHDVKRNDDGARRDDH